MKDNAVSDKTIHIKKMTKIELYAELEKFFINAGFSIVINNNIGKKRIYTLIKDGKKLDITVLIKNICECGWKDRKNIKRIQVLKMERPQKTTETQCFLLLGLTFVGDRSILVAWNPLKYIYHEKNRSAYVYDDHIFKAYDTGFFQVVQNGEKLLLCDENNFQKLLDRYYDYSFVEEMQ